MIDGGKHIGGRAEGERQSDRRKLLAAGRHLAAASGRFPRRSVLAAHPGRNRSTVFIADREDRPEGRPGAFAGEEILRQRLDDAPLDGAGVLRLVDEDVVDALVELVVDPGPTSFLVRRSAVRVIRSSKSSWLRRFFSSS